MRNLIKMLGALIITSGVVAPAVACKTPGDSSNNKNPDQQYIDRVFKKIEDFNSKGKAVRLADDVSTDNVTELRKAIINDTGININKDYSLQVSIKNQPNIDADDIQYGNAELKLLKDGKAVKNSENKDSITVEYGKASFDDFAGVTHILTAKEGSELNVSKVELGNILPGISNTTLGGLIDLALSMINMFDVPSTIPTNEKDPAYIQYEKLVDETIIPKIKNLPFIKKEGETYNIPVTSDITLDVTVKNWKDIFNSIMPDIIHMVNYIKSQQAAGISPYVTVVNYLVSDMDAILPGDNFKDTNINLIEAQSQTDNVKTNLDHLLFGLLQGFSFSGTKPTYHSGLSIKLGTDDIDFKFLLDGVGYKSDLLRNLLGNFINNDDIKADIKIGIKVDIPPLNIAQQIMPSVFKEVIKQKSKDVSYSKITFTVKSGKIKSRFLNKSNKWEDLNNLSQLLNAKSAKLIISDLHIDISSSASDEYKINNLELTDITVMF